jgi:hypothetical protein
LSDGVQGRAKMELHPETRWGYASLKNLIQFRNTEIATLTNSEKLNNIKRFVSEISEKTGISERTIYRDLQIATNLSEEVKDMIRGTELEKK